MVKVSVVIPAFDAERCLARAVASVQAQTLGDVEILICDDGSTDDSARIAQGLVAGDPRVRLLSSGRNGGPSAARNMGIAAATGRWVAMLDADDAYLPDRLGQLVAEAERQQADVIADNLLLFDWVAQRVVARAIAVDDQETRLISADHFVAQSMTGFSPFDFGQLKPMIRRSLLHGRGIRYPETVRHGEDFLFAMECLLAGARFVLTGRPGYLFTQRNGSVSATVSGVSRTVTDLEAMREQSLALLTRHRVRADPALARQLRRRASAIRWHQSWNKAYPFLRARRVGPLLGSALRDWRCAVMLVRYVTIHMLSRAQRACRRWFSGLPAAPGASRAGR